MRNFLYNFAIFFNYFILFYVAVFAFWQLLQIVGTIILIFVKRKQDRFVDNIMSQRSSCSIPISIITPAYNEGAVIIDSVKGMLKLDYPVYEVIVVNDGSTDDSMSKLIEAFNLRKANYPIRRQVPCAGIRGIYRNPAIPKLTVVDKVNGGKKADACNAGINVSRYPYFINMDADCLLDDDSLFWISRSFMKDNTCIAVGGIMRTNNGSEIKNYRVTKFGMPENWLARFQILEYGRSFLLGRILTAKLGCLMVISGAFGAFHKETVIKTGGYSLDCIGEDMELVMKLHHYMRKNKRKYKIAFSPKAICWTQSPIKYNELRGQRRRWQVGLIQVLSRYRCMFLNPRYGTIGMIGMPYQVLYEMLGPLVELAGLVVMPLSLYFGIITVPGLILFCTAGLQLGLLGSFSSLLADAVIFNRTIRLRDYLFLAFLCLADTITYRPITLLFRLEAAFCYKKYSHNWGTITRQSFQDTQLSK